MCAAPVDKTEQRLNEIKYWESELRHKREAVLAECDATVEFLVRLKKAFDACKEPLHIDQQCLVIRFALQKSFISDVEVRILYT